MTDRPVDPTTTDVPEGEPQAPSPEGAATEESGAGAFGDEAAEMVGETEVEVPPTAGDGSGAGAPGQDAQGQDAQEQDADVDTEVDDLTAMKGSLLDLTNDLQRLQAEYANYRKRVDRDRALVAENATFKALTPIIEVLDTIDRAREAGELEGGFKAVAEQLERAVTQAGLARFAEPGDAFDPNRHDALSHLGNDPEVEVTTVKVVAKAGYAIGERVVRAAQVLVVDPAEG